MKMLVALLLVTAALAQQQPPTTRDAGIIATGRVTDAQTRQPIRGVRVEIAQGRERTAHAFTDFRGRWEIATVPPRATEIRISKSGYAPVEREVRLPAPGPHRGLDLSLSRLGVITGRIFDARGKPLPWVRPSAVAEQQTAGSVDLRSFSRGGRSSDDRGMYRLWGLLPGRYVVFARPPSQAGVSGQIRYIQEMAFAPAVSEAADAQVVEVGPGSVVEGVDIVLRDAAATRVQGQIVGGATVCPKCSLQIFATDGEISNPLSYIRPSPDMRFAILGLPEGDYLANSRGWTAAGQDVVQGLTRFSVARDQVSVVRLQPAPAQPVSVRVVLEDPPDEIAANGRSWQAQLMVTTQGGDRRLYLSGRGMRASVQGSGLEATAELKLHNGPYELRLFGIREGYLDRIHADGRPLESRIVAPEGAPIPKELTAFVRFDTGTLSGSVLDWAGRADTVAPSGIQPKPVFVMVESETGIEGFPGSNIHRIGNRGTFRAQLPPGTYHVFAINRPTSTWNTDALKEARPADAVTAEIQPGQTTMVQVRKPSDTQP